MCFEYIKAKVNRNFFKNKFEPDIKNNKTDGRVNTSRSCIPECLQAHHFSEWRVKKIYQGKNQVSCTMYMSSHGWGQR